jgi:hypothetical protein
MSEMTFHCELRRQVKKRSSDIPYHIITPISRRDRQKSRIFTCFDLDKPCFIHFHDLSLGFLRFYHPIFPHTLSLLILCHSSYIHIHTQTRLYVYLIEMLSSPLDCKTPNSFLESLLKYILMSAGMSLMPGGLYVHVRSVSRAPVSLS